MSTSPAQVPNRLPDPAAYGGGVQREPNGPNTSAITNVYGISTGPHTDIYGMLIGNNSGTITIIQQELGRTRSQQLLAAIRQANMKGKSKPDCPYPGLRPFGPTDLYFTGRAQAITQLLLLLEQSRLAMVTGPSSAGKSSLLFGGLLPNLPSNETWHILVLVPGINPTLTFHTLLKGEQEDLESAEDPAKQAAQVLKNAGATRLLLLIDQADQLFLQTAAPERQVFLQKLAAWHQIEECWIVLAVNNEYAPMVRAALPYVRDLPVEPLAGAELRDAIIDPAKAVLGETPIEEGLVQHLIDDADRESGRMPLLQVLLTTLWREMPAGELQMRAQDYEQLAGPSGSAMATVLALQAEAVIGAMASNQRALAYRIITRLLLLTADSEDIIGCAQPLSALLGPTDDPMVLQILKRNRLITIRQDPSKAEPDIDLSHSRLVEAWPKFREWLTAHKSAELLRRRLEDQARKWNPLEAAGLLNEMQLDEAERWVASPDGMELGGASDKLTRLLAASQQQRANALNRVRRYAIGLATLLLIALAAATGAVFAEIHANENAALASARQEEAQTNAGLAAQAASTAKAANALANQQAQAAAAAQVVAQQQAQVARASEAVALQQKQAAETAQAEANEARRQAESILGDKLAAQARSSNDRPMALLTGLVALRYNPTSAVRATFQTLLANSTPLVGFLWGHDHEVVAVAYSPDGQSIATGDDSGKIIIWDAHPPRQPRGQPLSGGSRIDQLAFSPDGQTLVAVTKDGMLCAWDVQTQAEVWPKLDAGHRNPRGNRDALALAIQGNTAITGGAGGEVHFWDIRPGVAPDKRRVDTRTEHKTNVRALAVSPDGQWFASGSDDATIVLWNTQTHQKIMRITDPRLNAVYSLAISPDGRQLAAGQANYKVMLWDVTTITAPSLIEPPEDQASLVTSVAFSPDGRFLVSASEDGQIQVRNPRTGELRGSPLSTHGGPVRGVAFAPTGDQLVAGSGDSRVSIWDLADRLVGPADEVWKVAWSPQRQILAVGGRDPSVTLWDLSSHPAISHTLTTPVSSAPSIPNSERAITDLTFNRNGDILATGSRDGALILWHITDTGDLPQIVTTQAGDITKVAFGPDNATVIVAGLNGSITRWTPGKQPAQSGEVVAPINRIKAMAFSPDGNFLVAGGDDRQIHIWNWHTQQEVTPPLSIGGSVLDLAFSPPITDTPAVTHTVLAGAGGDGVIYLWNWDASGPRAAEPKRLQGHRGEVRGLAFSSDGHLLASASQDSTVRLWDIATGQVFGDPLMGHQKTVRGVAFIQNDQWMASASEDKTVVLWNLDPSDPRTRACQIVNRDFTDPEWYQYIAQGTKNQKTCSELP